MLKEFSWKAFENTGNLDAYMFYKEIVENSTMPMDQIAAHEEVATTVRK
ncbi:MAG: YqzL family protein [Clostridia bacterium]|nr:YqzL family protein [Clostridia bacterium]